jgi:hypothetical protein
MATLEGVNQQGALAITKQVQASLSNELKKINFTSYHD